MFDAYNHTWHGSGQFTPTNIDSTASYKALKWALMSSFDSQPALNVGLILHDPKHGGIARLLGHRNVHLLCTFPKRALPHQPQDAWYNSRTNTPRNKICLALIIVSNFAGRQIYYHPAYMATLKAAFQTQGIQSIDWKEDDTRTLKLDDGVFPTKGYNRANAKMATLQLNHIQEPLHEEGIPAEWLLAFKGYHNQLAKRFSSPSSIVYTDGSNSAHHSRVLCFKPQPVWNTALNSRDTMCHSIQHFMLSLQLYTGHSPSYMSPNLSDHK